MVGTYNGDPQTDRRARITDDAAGREAVQFYLALWEDMANQHGWVVVAPQFDQVRFNSFYQRLNKERGNQAWAL